MLLLRVLVVRTVVADSLVLPQILVQQSIVEFRNCSGVALIKG